MDEIEITVLDPVPFDIYPNELVIVEEITKEEFKRRYPDKEIPKDKQSETHIRDNQRREK